MFLSCKICSKCGCCWSCLLILSGLAACRWAVLLNLKYNETIASFSNAAGVGSGEQLRASASRAKPGGGACTCIAFRTGQPLRLPLPLSPIHPPTHQHEVF